MNTSLLNYTLHLADTTLILSQRNSEWCAHGPILEQDIAITNISLDLIGQSRYLYQYAAKLLNPVRTDVHPGGESANNSTNATEDSLAYLRTEREFKNLLLTELPKGDWAQTVLRQFLFSVYQYLLFEQLQNSKDEQLAAIAQKSIKETTYHLKWSSDWVIRLGDGTEESHTRMNKAIETLWEYTGELFIAVDYEIESAKNGTGTDISSLKQQWIQKVKDVFEEATLQFPIDRFMQTGGKQGSHTENLGYILAEMQSLQRTYPGAEW